MSRPMVKAKNGKTGQDLNAILREVVAAELASLGWSETKLATEWGVSQRNVNRWLKGEHGLNVENLSTLCAALEVNPLDLFRRHEAYSHQRDEKLRYAKDGAYDLFRTTLDLAEAKLVLKNVREQKRLGIFAICTETIEGIIRVAKAARAQAFREARSSGDT